MLGWLRPAAFVRQLSPLLGRAGEVAARKLFILIAAINPNVGTSSSSR